MVSFTSHFLCYDIPKGSALVCVLLVLYHHLFHICYPRDQGMANYNRVIMVGNLTRDPEYKQLASGQALCKLSLASNRQFRNRQTDSMVQEVCFVDIDVWGAQAESCRQYLQKGRAILVEGRLKFDTWQDNNGQTRSKHAIVADRVLFLSSSAEVSDTVSGARVDTAKDGASEQLEKELLDQIEEIKARSDVKPATKTETEEKHAVKKKVAVKKEATVKEVEASAAQGAGQEAPAVEVKFKDEPPFEDDLPF